MAGRCITIQHGDLRRLSQAALGALLWLSSSQLGFVSAAAADSKAVSSSDLPPEARAFLFGEEPTKPPDPAPRSADGHPDLSGFWKGSPATTPVGNIGKDLPGFKLPLTSAGAGALQHNLAATVDPESLCIIGGIPRHSASALPFEIVQNSNRVVFLYLYTYFRSIPVDGRAHDPDPDPSFFGDKIGRWEKDTLVIDSTGFKGSPESPIWIDENANPQSDAMHTIERWTRPDANHLHLELTIDDPKFYTRAFSYSRTWLLGKPREGLQEYSCSENNVDRDHLGPGPGPIKPDGTRGYLIPDLPKTPPPPEFYDKPSKP
jgi:hypothetical protein